MADKNQIAAVLEHLLNNEQQKAEEMFHEYVVGKSREIYENLIDSEIDEEVKDEDLDETADEDLDETNEDDLDENFEDITAEGDDETGDLETDIAAPGEGEEDEEEFGGEEGEEEGEDDEPATKGDLKDIVDELEAAFAKYAGGDHAEPDADNMGGPSDMDMDNMPGMMKDEFDLETVREYVEKVPAGHGAEKKGAAEKADNTKSSVAGKNDMGGTTANILSSKEDSPSYAGAGGTIKGNGLTKQKPQDMNTGNVNVVGGTNAKAFYSKNSQGHGAEKKGTAESGVDATSIIRGSR
jgi:hypothetical protein